MTTYLITGTSRGIGLELVKQLSALPSSQVKQIFALTRSPTTAFKNLPGSDRVVNIVTALDDPAALKNAAKEVEGHLNGAGLDVLVNNAGIMIPHDGTVDTVPATHLVETYNVNVVNTHLVTGAFLPLLKKGKEKKVINISSTLGSVEWSYAWGPIGLSYRASKAALNMVNSLYAQQFKDEGFTFLLISPGWLKTDLGSQYADLDPEIGVKSVVHLIQDANPSQNGKSLNINVPGYHVQEGPKAYTGQEIPW